MIYIFKNDVSYFFHHNKKILMIYIGLVLGYWGLQRFSNYITVDTFYDTLGLNIGDSGLLEYILFIFTIGVYIYICARIFTKDLKVGMDHIFLRMNSSKWFLYKWMTIFMITFLLKLTIYILIIVLIGLGNIPDHLFLVFLSDIIYTSIIQMIVITIYTLTKRHYIFLFLFLLFLLFLGMYLPICIIATIKYLYIYIIILGIMSIGNFILIGKNHIYLFE